MPLPLILGAVAIAAGGWGVKKGFDAKADFSRAKSITTEAQSTFEEGREELEAVRRIVQQRLESLGKEKAFLYERGLIPFVDYFQKIKNIDFHDPNIASGLRLAVNAADMLEVQEIALRMVDVLQGGAAALGSGALAGLAAFGGVGALATASTGAAISGLAGAAATNATLAWFGGGSLAAGGMGMAGGAAVLGGIVAGPVLAVGGMVMASKAAKAVEDAQANLAKAAAAVEEMKTAEVAARTIQRRAEEMADVLEKLEDCFMPALVDLRALVAEATDYATYDAAERQLVMRCAALAKTVKNVLEAPLFDADGAVTRESRRAVQEARDFVAKLASM
ncbi:conserved membrane protein of unknown function [Rhodovastum atsumiense]|uniref:Chemotaxis protein n=1 Tax=Rhodovastum atsumiense TaxID=504468 RepID=A0A5M6IQJ4_9PROT|nr:hypothetical protein [Rhodovastum atsumiense]KAA5609838.1 hypothetical protein F1189_22370 [Rhodovastum atsumiense]CAH2603753.1 conserved membrane protein of unknown function [Rhodovastum atsumiense]